MLRRGTVRLFLRPAGARQTRAALAASAKKVSPAPAKAKGGEAVAMAGSKKGAGKAEKQTTMQEELQKAWGRLQGDIKRMQKQQEGAAARNAKVRLSWEWGDGGPKEWGFRSFS